MSKPGYYIVLHSTDTPLGRDVTVEDILLWHTGSKDLGHNGWSRPGYTEFIDLAAIRHSMFRNDANGVVDPEEVTNGAFGFNSIAVHLCTVGGNDAEGNPAFTLSPSMEASQLEAIKAYGTDPNTGEWRENLIAVIGHNQISSKPCPGYDVFDWGVSVGIPEDKLLKGKL